MSTANARAEEKEWLKLSKACKVVGISILGETQRLPCTDGSALCACSTVRNILRRTFNLSNLFWTGLSLVVGLDCNITAYNIKRSIGRLTYADVVSTGLLEEGKKEINKIKAIQSKQGIVASLQQGMTSATGVITSGVQAALGTPEQNKRLLGIGLGKQFFEGTWLFRYIWEAFVFGGFFG